MVIVFESVLPVYLVNLGREAMKNWFASCTEAELRNLASLGSVKNICVSRSLGQVNPAENLKQEKSQSGLHMSKLNTQRLTRKK